MVSRQKLFKWGKSIAKLLTESNLRLAQIEGIYPSDRV
jgi:hypothetical protein